MNHRSLQRNERLREQLAAGYVLGTLKGRARRRFEQWLAIDAVLSQAVTRWQNRLIPMAEFSAAAQPPQRVWQAIAQRLGLESARTQSASSFWHRLRGDLAFWRGFSLAASALAAVLALVLILQPPPAPGYVATLSGDNAQPAVVVTGDARQRTLTIRVVTGQPVDPDKSLELWAVPQTGSPRSIGLIEPGGTVTLTLPENVTPQTMPLLAVSLEPKGGSPNPNAPTGPILYKGAWLQI